MCITVIILQSFEINKCMFLLRIIMGQSEIQIPHIIPRCSSWGREYPPALLNAALQHGNPTGLFIHLSDCNKTDCAISKHYKFDRGIIPHIWRDGSIVGGCLHCIDMSGNTYVQVDGCRRRVNIHTLPSDLAAFDAQVFRLNFGHI